MQQLTNVIVRELGVGLLHAFVVVFAIENVGIGRTGNLDSTTTGIAADTGSRNLGDSIRNQGGILKGIPRGNPNVQISNVGHNVLRAEKRSAAEEVAVGMCAAPVNHKLDHCFAHGAVKRGVREERKFASQN